MDSNKADGSQISKMITTNLVIDSSNRKKWKCSQCTYENWPSALKCTICLACKIQTQKLKQNQPLLNSSNNKQSINRSSSSKIRVIKLKEKRNNEFFAEKTTTNLHC